jgi:hypothetical protein
MRRITHFNDPVIGQGFIGNAYFELYVMLQEMSVFKDILLLWQRPLLNCEPP